MNKNGYSLEQAHRKLSQLCSPDYETQKGSEFLALALYTIGVNLNEEDREMFYIDIIHQLNKSKALEVRKYLYDKWFIEKKKRDLNSIIEGSAIDYKERKARLN